MTIAQWTPEGYVAECPTTHERFVTTRAIRVGAHVHLYCRWCDTHGRPRADRAFDPTQPNRHEYEIDQVSYDTQGVTT